MMPSLVDKGREVVNRIPYDRSGRRALSAEVVQFLIVLAVMAAAIVLWFFLVYKPRRTAERDDSPDASFKPSKKDDEDRG
jgi:hypothetical protein